ncbi:MAG: UDP-N-acetylmuramoyl-tripeptide--D-alanyl-D-alanine ligase [Humidesulfovibrio sp.]|nr:UDP-N-acetylmuramoyl-tripeptide--D-alanyl-D-alanine ligase [Humidesulfovibrio sp.]
MNLTLRDIALRLNGSVLSGPDADRVVTAVRTDSREVVSGDLFFCLKGERFDAHDYASQVADAGAGAIVASRELPGVKCPVILVSDTQKALGDLARFWRDGVPAKVIAITGTAGKTTAKELLAQTLGSVLSVAKNHKNFNNQIGLPLSMLAATGQEDAWVMEVGISKPHDMAELGAIIAPDLGIVLNIGPAHLEGLGDLEGVARAKAALLSFVKPGGQGLCSMDYPELWAEACRVRPGVIGFSAKDSFAKYYARFEEALPGGRGLYEIIVDGQAFWAELPACGAHFAENAAAVAGACHLLGLTPEQIAAGLGAAALPDQRFCCREAGAWRVVDDTYNANPLSMRRSIEAARLLAGEGRLVLVLGDMKELGANAAKAHEDLGAVIAAAAPEAVFFQGEFAAAVARGIASAVGGGVTAVSEPAQVLAALATLNGGTVLVKGSRSCHMERYAQALAADLCEKEGAL